MEVSFSYLEVMLNSKLAGALQPDGIIFKQLGNSMYIAVSEKQIKNLKIVDKQISLVFAQYGITKTTLSDSCPFR